MGRKLPSIPELQEVKRTRTTPDIPHTLGGRSLPESLFWEKRCDWSCPCGGTVPDAPSHCQFSSYNAKAQTYCTDAVKCVRSCGDRVSCRAYANFQEKIRERRARDLRKREKVEDS